MSVRAGDQKPGHLVVIKNARKLIDYTYDRISDTDIFPKAQRWLVAKDIWTCASEAYMYIVRANSIKVESQLDAETRVNYEKEALAGLEAMLTYIDICNIKHLISNDRTEYWTGLVVEVINPLRGLLRADKSRYILSKPKQI